MALQFKQRRSLISMKLAGAFFAIFAFVIQSVVSLNLPVAFASTPVSVSSVIADKDNGYRSATVDGSEYLDLTFSFNYDARSLDATDYQDSFTYGWTVGGVDHTLGTVEGLSGNKDAEVDSISEALPAAALASGLAVYVNVDSSHGSPVDDVELTDIKLEGTDKPVMQACSATDTVAVNDLGSWDLSETRSGGHNELVANGLHAWTESNTSQDKAAGYFYGASANFALKDAGTPSIEFASYTGVRPGLQLGLDKDGNGTWDGFLVYEPWAYGEGKYWSNKDFGVGAGGGYPSMGTLQQYLDANPSARVLSIGYSLGSGVKGDAVISSLTAGCTTYAFAAPADTTKPTATLVEPSVGSYNPSEIVVEAHDETALDRVTGNLYDGANLVLLKSCSASAGNALNYTLRCTVPALSNGTYTVRANARDNAGHISSTTVRQFKVDHASPTVTVKSSSIGSMSDNVFSKADFKLHDNDKVKGYSINGGTFYNVTPSAWSDANNIRVGVRGAVYGNNTITVQDMAGNTGSYDFKLDNIGPDISVKSTSIGTESVKTFSKVSFKLHDTYKVDKLTLNGQEKDLSDNVWSDFNDVAPGKYGAVEGENTLVVYDVSGNATTYMFTLDTEAPDGSFTYDPSNNVVKKGPVTVTLHTSEPIQTPDGWTKGDATTFSKAVSTNGKYYVTIEDFGDNSKELMYEVKRIDTTPPAIEGVNDGDIRNSSLAGFTVTDQNLDTVMVDGVEIACTYSGSSWIWNCPSVSGEGAHTIVATDKAGNTVEVRFEIDMTAPNLSNLSYVQNNDNTFTLSVITDDPATVVFKLDGSEVAGATSEDNGDGTWRWTALTGVLAVNSNHTFSAKSMDTAGNSKSVADTFSVEPPTTNTIGDGTTTIDRQLTAGVTTPTANLFGTTGNIDNPQSEDTADEGEVLGTQDSSSPVDTTAALAPSEQGWKLFGIAWYWWLIAATVLAGLWWTVASLRRRQAEADPSAGL